MKTQEFVDTPAAVVQKDDMIQLVRDIADGKKVAPYFVTAMVMEDPVVGEHTVTIKYQRLGQQTPKLMTCGKLHNIRVVS